MPVLFYSCGEGCGGPVAPYVMPGRYFAVADSSDRIVSFGYKDLEPGKPDTRVIKWECAVSRPYTEMYIHTAKGDMDTVIVRCDKKLSFVSNECGDYISLWLPEPVIVSNTFDSMYKARTNDTIYFR